MMLKETLKNIVRSQKKDIEEFEEGIERDKTKEIEIKIPFAIIISGIRRCGKSTLLRQMMKKVKNFYYFNFEDPRASDFEVEDFQKLDEVFKDEIGKNEIYFFDEIQNVKKWELFVRMLLDRKKNVVITGSNASLLSKELGAKLTGRHLRYELFPFSFDEYLKLTKQRPNIDSFEEYFIKGGFPEYLKLKRAEILQELFNDIIMRDIVARYNIHNAKIVKNLAVYLITNAGKEFSYNSLKKIFNLGSTNTIIKFISYFEDSYLLFTIQKFDFSLKKQIISPKKIYSLDNGLSNVNSASFFDDRGKMLENIVFINLRRKNREIFYFQEKNECDFIIKNRTKFTEAIQVCYLFSEDNKEREINGLKEAMTKFNLNEGLVLTYNQEDTLYINGKKIKILPVWKWILSL